MRALNARILLLGSALGYQIGNAGPIAGLVADDFAVSLAEAGLVASAALATHGASQLPAAAPIMRFGPRAVTRVCLVLVVLADLAALTAGSIWLLIATRLVLGIGTGPVFVCAVEWTRSVAGPRAAGLFGGAAALGVGLGILAGGLTESAGGSWRLPIGIAALAAALAWPALGDGGRATGVPGGAVRAMLRVPAIWRYALVHTASFGSSLVLGAWIVAFLTGRGADPALAGIAGFVILGLGVVVRPLGGTIAARGVRPVVPIVGGLTLAAAGLVALVAPLHAVTVVPALVALGAGFALPFAPAFAQVAAVAGDRSPAGTAFVNAAGNVFALAATPLVAFDVEHYGGELSWVLLAGLALLAAWIVHRSDRRTPEPA